MAASLDVESSHQDAEDMSSSAQTNSQSSFSPETNDEVDEVLNFDSPVGSPLKRGKRTRGPKRPKKAPNRQAVASTDIEELCTVDYVGAANANVLLGPTPESKKADKRKAMNEIIANVSEEDKPVAKADAARLIEASKRFRGLAKHTSGRWAIKGMKTSLYHYQVRSRIYSKTPGFDC